MAEQIETEKLFLRVIFATKNVFFVEFMQNHPLVVFCP